jgi:hypothetical protein
MQHIIKALLVVLLFVGSLNVRAQERLFASADFMHLPEFGSEIEYMALEKLWLRIHQKAVDEGRCLGWYLFRIENDSRNQFVTVRVYGSANKLFDPWPGQLPDLFQRLYSEEEAAIMEKADEIRVLTRSEAWEIEATVMKTLADPDLKPSDYIQIDYMKATPEKINDYYETEKGVFSKIQRLRMGWAEIKYWLFLSRWFPSGHDAEYDFLTVNGFADKSASEKPWDIEKINAALSEEEGAKADKIFELRTAVRREFWRPVLQTKPAQR